MKNDAVYLSHIRDAISKIEKYLAGADHDTLSGNDMMLDAVIRELAVIGEAAKNLSEEFKGAHQHIPWRKITNMRNLLIHEYFGVNTKIVWDTCQNNLPILKDFLAELQ
jgi:uncharacterized protein with HEPN domain